MALQLKSYQQILGDMIRKMLSSTGLNDLNKGSVLSTFLEAAAQEDFAQYGALIELLDNFSLDSTSGADLDKKAAEYGLARQAATSASGFVTISDSTFDKISTGIYIGASPPIAGDTTLNVSDASEFPAVLPISIYIGRGTSNFEGPISLSALPVNNGSYWSLTLATPLVKNHNYSETVIVAQGGNRTVPAGTIVKIPANNLSAEVTFKVANDQLVADGENVLNNILVFATQPGAAGNAPLRSIVQFSSIPFNGAEVVNPAPFSNARELESDQGLRDRIKNHVQSLSRGTSSSILSGVIGVSDPTDNKRVASASLVEPTVVTDIAHLYIDDGTGFEPSYSGQGYEIIIDQAAGTEQFLQLGNFPVVKAQVESSASQPFAIYNGDTLIVRVNDVEETITFLAADFSIEGAAKAIEVAEAINNRSTLVEARTTDGQKRVVVFAKALENEKLQIAGGTANDYLLFSTSTIYTLRLYKNDVPLTKDGETAFVESAAYGSWSAIPTTATLNIQVDGKPTIYLRIQSNLLEVSLDGATYVTFNGTTFNDLGTDISSANVAQWVAILDQLIPGAEVTENSDKIKITSNQESTSDSMIQIAGGNLAGPQGWSTTLKVGRASDFTLNRFNGQIELTTPLSTNDRVTAGTEYTRGLLSSVVAAGGIFSLPIDDGRDPVMYVVIDGEVEKRIVNTSSGCTITVTLDGSQWRYTCSVAAFVNVQIGDYVAIVDRGGLPAWLASNNCGLFRVTDVDPSGFYFLVYGPSNSAEGPFTVDQLTDIQAFASTTPPQKVSFTPGLVPIATVVSELNAQLVGAETEQMSDNTLRLYTRNYGYEGGAITIPVMFGKTINLGLSQATALSIESHVAFAQSLEETGLRVSGLQGSETSGDVASPYTTVTDTSRTFLSDGTLPGQWVRWQDNTNEDLKGIISTINSNTQLTLRDNGPALVSSDFLGPTSIGDTYQQYDPFDLEDVDNLVVVLDGDDVNKTYNVPMSRRGRVSATSGISMFNGLDDDANVGGASFGGTIWSGYDFADYKVWFKAHQVINPTNDKNAMIIRAKDYGPTGNKTRIGFVYPASPDTALTASVVPSGDYSTVTVQLGSGTARLTTQAGDTQFTISIPVAGQTKYTWSGGTDPGFGIVTLGDIVSFSSTNFSTGNNGAFKILATDNATYVTVYDSAGVPETKTLGSSAAMSIYPLSGNTGTTVVNVLNSTAIVNSVVDAILTSLDPFGTTNDGSGLVEYSTIDDPAIGSQYILLLDGENWIRTFNNPGPPQFVLKTPLTFINVTGGAGYIYELHTCPSYGTSNLGEQFRLIPTTAKNLADHLNKSTITALSINATIERAGERVQISSKLVGSQGQVYISGGLGNSCLMAIQGNAALSGSYLKVPVLEAAVSGFHAPQIIKATNQFVTNKVNTFDSTTAVDVDTPIGTDQQWTLGKRPLSFTPAVTSITVTNPSTNVMRLTISAGPGSFNAVELGDEIHIPFASTTFDPRNRGTFPVVAVDGGGTWVEVTNPYVSAEGPIVLAASTDLMALIPFFTEYPKEVSPSTLIKVEKLSRGFVRYRWLGTGSDPNFYTNGLRVDDLVTIGGDSFTQANKGKFRVIGVADDMFEIVNDNAVEERVEIGDTFLKVDNLFLVSGATVAVTVSGVVATYTLSLGSWNAIPPVGSVVRIQGAPFNAANLGTFRVVDSAATYISVINAGGGFPETLIGLVSLTDMEYENTFTFMSVDSTEVGDSLVIGAIGAAWFEEENQGHLSITEVGRDATADGQHYVKVMNANGVAESSPVSLGANYNSFYVLEGYPFVTYREIDNICIDPSNANQYFVYFTPTENAGRIVRSAGTQFTAMNKLGFPDEPQIGVDGYKYWTGLLRRVQRTVDGYDADPITYPGIKAAGVQVEVTPPLLQRVSIGVDVKTSSGTPLSILTDSIKSAILSYVTSLGVGEDVILSQIVKRVQEVPGVEAVRITDPAPISNEAPERIIIQDNEKAIAFEEDVVVG